MLPDARPGPRAIEEGLAGATAHQLKSIMDLSHTAKLGTVAAVRTAGAATTAAAVMVIDAARRRVFVTIPIADSAEGPEAHCKVANCFPASGTI